MSKQKNLNVLTERYESHDDDESDKHLEAREARDRRYLCLKIGFYGFCFFFQFQNCINF